MCAKTRRRDKDRDVLKKEKGAVITSNVLKKLGSTAESVLRCNRKLRLGGPTAWWVPLRLTTSPSSPAPMSSPSSSTAAARPGIEELPLDIVSDEEMAIIEAALAAAAARPLLSSAARRAAQLSCAAYSAAGHGGEIEDCPPQRMPLMARFRERRALAVTDITATVGRPNVATFSLRPSAPGSCRLVCLQSGPQWSRQQPAFLLQEWCDKQMEFVLEHGKPERTAAMKAGSDRHAQLEQEVSPAFWFFLAECCLVTWVLYPNVPRYIYANAIILPGQQCSNLRLFTMI